jgi:hypothetical protein
MTLKAEQCGYVNASAAQSKRFMDRHWRLEKRDHADALIETCALFTEKQILQSFVLGQLCFRAAQIKIATLTEITEREASRCAPDGGNRSPHFLMTWA